MAALRVIIFGGTGFLGRGLATRLAAGGADVTVVSRGRHTSVKSNKLAGVRHAPWDGHTLGDWASCIDGARAIVNLAGRTVDCVKTPDNCDEILRSRVESTRIIGDAVQAASNRPRVWVQMSTAHIYGDPASEVCDEHSALGYGLAPFVGRAWESEFDTACPTGVRRVILRTGFVLGPGGGAMPRLASLCRWGLGGQVGHGRQGMSWIHEDDMHRIMQRAIDDESMSGVYVATAPNPVSNREFMKAMRKFSGGLGGLGVGLPAPAWLVRIGAPLVMRTDPELAIYGRYCVPRRLLAEGLTFQYVDIDAALRAIKQRS